AWRPAPSPTFTSTTRASSPPDRVMTGSVPSSRHCCVRGTRARWPSSRSTTSPTAGPRPPTLRGTLRGSSRRSALPEGDRRMVEEEMGFASVQELEARLARPSAQLVEDMSRVTGDVMLLGAAGKMGPSMAMLARNALEGAGNDAQVIAVSRFSDQEVERRLNDSGVKTVRADLLEEDQLAGLPDAPNVIYLAAMKFG